MKEENINSKIAIREYIRIAISQAVYKKIGENGKENFVGKIPICRDVIAFGKTLEECKTELLSTLEDWVEFGLRHGFDIPVVEGIDLNILADNYLDNEEITCEKMEALRA